MAVKTRVKYTSKGQRPSVAKRNKVKSSSIDSILNKFNSYIKGKKSYVTIPNPDPTQTNKRMIRVPYNYSSDLLTDWRKASSGVTLK